jgi:hypothetical protein
MDEGEGGSGRQRGYVVAAQCHHIADLKRPPARGVSCA